MIDIHCHLLYGVDDGAQTIEESIAMLQSAKEQGLEAIVLTPHYRHGMFSYPNERIEAHYIRLLPYAQELEIGLALGTEYHVNSQIIEAMETKRCRTMAGSRYVLSEYSHDTEYSYIYQMTRDMLAHGYIPIIAHVERYGCMTEDIDRAGELRELGAWIQLNADAVLGLEGRGPKKYCKKMLLSEYVDVIASDSHGLEERACHMKQCSEYISKKFDSELAAKLMYDNPAMILQRSNR